MRQPFMFQRNWTHITWESGDQNTPTHVIRELHWNSSKVNAWCGIICYRMIGSFYPSLETNFCKWLHRLDMWHHNWITFNQSTNVFQQDRLPLHWWLHVHGFRFYIKYFHTRELKGMTQFSGHLVSWISLTRTFFYAFMLKTSSIKLRYEILSTWSKRSQKQIRPLINLGSNENGKKFVTIMMCFVQQRCPYKDIKWSKHTSSSTLHFVISSMDLSIYLHLKSIFGNCTDFINTLYYRNIDNI